jgi:DNA-binding FrmR family transcriptional regulator
MAELLEEHLRTHVLDRRADAKRRQAADEVATVFRRSFR